MNLEEQLKRIEDSQRDLREQVARLEAQARMIRRSIIRDRYGIAEGDIVKVKNGTRYLVEHIHDRDIMDYPGWLPWLDARKETKAGWHKSTQTLYGQWEKE